MTPTASSRIRCSERTAGKSLARGKTALFAACLAIVVAQIAGDAALPPPPVADSLPYANSFLVTGNYVVSSVDLPKAGGMGTIHINKCNPAANPPVVDNCIPADADIQAAYLYWETISVDVSSALGGATFRSNQLYGTDGVAVTPVKTTEVLQLPGLPAANCWGSAGGANSTLTIFRADVLHFLPNRLFSRSSRWFSMRTCNSS